MSYFDVYKSRLTTRTGNLEDPILQRSKGYIARHFNEHPAYKKALLTRPTLKTEEIDVRIINIDKTSSKKKIYLLPDMVVELGSYISFEDKVFIVTDFEYNIITPFCNATLCNQSLTIDKEVSIPCYVTNDSYGSKTTATSSLIVDIDTKLKILVQDNDITKKLLVDTRLMFNHSATDIFRVVDITTSVYPGITVMITKKDKLVEFDDLENNYCWQFYNKNNIAQTDYIIKGEPLIKVGKIYEFSLEPSTTEGNVSFEVDNTEIAVVDEISGKKCFIRPLIGNEIFTLKAIDSQSNTVLCEKNIITTIY